MFALCLFVPPLINMTMFWKLKHGLYFSERKDEMEARNDKGAPVV